MLPSGGGEPRTVEGTAENPVNHSWGSGDFDGDGRLELVVGRTDPLECRFHSLPDERIVFALSPHLTGIGAVGDVDGDGGDDLCLYDFMADEGGINSGTTRILSIWNPKRGAFRNEPLLLHAFHGDRLGDRMGAAVDLGDLDADGHDDFAVAAYLATGPMYHSGRIRVHSGRTGEALFEVFGNSAVCRLGLSCRAGDFDADGTPDFVTAGAWCSNADAEYAGLLRVYSGRDGHLLLDFHGLYDGQGVGASPLSPGDVNDDGYSDVVVLCGMQRPVEGGRVLVFSGRPLENPAVMRTPAVLPDIDALFMGIHGFTVESEGRDESRH